MTKYYIGAVKHGTPASQATLPYIWTADGNYCVGSNGVPTFGVACVGQSRPPLICPPGEVVIYEPLGIRRHCGTPAEAAEAEAWRTKSTPTQKLTTIPGLLPSPTTTPPLPITPATTTPTGAGGVSMGVSMAALGALVLLILFKK